MAEAHLLDMQLSEIAASICEILTLGGLFMVVALVPIFLCHVCRVERNEDR